MATKYKDCSTAPLVVGGVYEKLQENGLFQRVLVVCASQAVNGVWRGEALAYGEQPLDFIEGTETMSGWTLVSQPEALAEPIASDDLSMTAAKRLETEKAVLEKRVMSLEKQAKGEALTPNDVFEMMEKHGKSYGDIAKAHGIHHLTVRKLYNDAKTSRQAPRARG